MSAGVTPSAQQLSEQMRTAAADLERAAFNVVGALGGRQRELADAVVQPARRLLRDVARAADVAIDPFVGFVEQERQLADQMVAWAELQHQLADHMLAWAKAQREVAAAFELWLTPAAGAARATSSALHHVAGDSAAASPERH